MRFILVVDRKHMFPGLSPQGFLPRDAVDVREAEQRAFFAERDFMENCSHYKQLIPYIALVHNGHVLCYQRQAKHSEQRLGGLWTVGFGGHIEPIDRQDESVREVGLLTVAARRELEEETGIQVTANRLKHRGFINSEREEVSSVHFGVFYTVDLSEDPRSREELAKLVDAQAEPFRVAWRTLSELDAEIDPRRPDREREAWEDWTRIVWEGGGLS